ncbi:MAG TPA: hypothetical protein VGP07_20405 [Polyangia bacterium]|jgi:hypothetical protein
MKVLLFLTGFRQVEEYDYFSRFLQRQDTLSRVCDVFIYCNNPDISEQIVTFYRAFAQQNKRLFITSVNAGFVMGAVEAVSNGIEMGVFTGYDYVIHLHPDVFITDEAPIVRLLEDNADDDCVFLVNHSLPDDERAFSFDFFVFKPGRLTENIFIDELPSYQDIPEHFLFDMLTRKRVPYKVVPRFDSGDWFPRRIDDQLKLYHEHDLGLVEALWEAGMARPAERSTTVVAKWQPPVVELHPSSPQKR